MCMCVLFLRLSTSFAYYGLAMDLQKFGVNIYLIQVIFGAVDIPAKVVITVSMSVIGRRPSQSGALILAGVSILCNLLVPHGMSGHSADGYKHHQGMNEIWESPFCVFDSRPSDNPNLPGCRGQRLPGRLLQLLLPLLRGTVPNCHSVLLTSTQLCWCTHG